MLAALLLAGFATATLVPMMFSSDDDEDILVDDSGADNAAEDILTGLGEGTVYDIPAVASQSILNTFDAETDRLKLNVDSWEAEFTFETPEDGGVRLSYGVQDGVVSVEFPNLETMPIDAIQLSVQAEGEETPTLLNLADMLGEEEDEPLAPTDPDAPEVLPGLPLPVDPLDPIDPDTLDVPVDPIDVDILQPIDPDLPDIVDTLGGLLDDAASVASDLAFRGSPVEIEDFGPTDVLSVQLLDSEIDGPAVVTITPSQDGDDGLVAVNDIVVAVLTGTPAAEPEQIQLDLVPRII